MKAELTGLDWLDQDRIKTLSTMPFLVSRHHATD